MSLGDVSIVIPAFRASDTLGRTVESCLPHVRPHDLIIVIDGPDAELEQVARDCAPGARILAQPQGRGAPACRNLGLELAETPFVMFLDADDYLEGPLLPGACARARATQADVVFGRFAFEYPDGSRIAADPNIRYGDFRRATILRRWLLEDFTPPCAIVWRTDFVRALGGWDESLAKNQDGDIVYRALLRGAIAAGVGEGQGVYVQHDNPGRISRRHNRRTLESQHRVLEKIRELLPMQPFSAEAELGMAYYSLAQSAFTIGCDDIGVQAERTARALGLTGQPGNLAHALVASMFGLRGKQKLVGMVRRSIAPSDGAAQACK